MRGCLGKFGQLVGRPGQLVGKFAMILGEESESFFITEWEEFVHTVRSIVLLFWNESDLFSIYFSLDFF